VTGLDDFIGRIQKVRERLGVSNSNPWFRGHASGKDELKPTLLRKSFIDAPQIKNHKQFEKNLVCNFVTRAGSEVSAQIDTWQLLGLMRHYEMPTRLLDWTTSLSIALYFAVADSDGDQYCDPHIWVMNPHLLNKKSTGQIIVFDSVDRLEISYFECLLGTKEYEYNGPVALKIPLDNPRIRSQRGCFTFHGAGLDGTEISGLPNLDQVGARIARRIEIPPELVEKIRLLLTLEGVDAYFVYPELHNLSRSLTRDILKQRSARPNKPPPSNKNMNIEQWSCGSSCSSTDQTKARRGQ
jgi:hypothetical protein